MELLGLDAMMQFSNKLKQSAFEQLSEAAQNQSRITGFTHSFYRYPARFSPVFAATTIEMLSTPGDLILDPYMGGGTTVVEAAVRGRHVVGNDLNSLAVFLAKAKTTHLSPREVSSVSEWATKVVPELNYRAPIESLRGHIDTEKTRNLHLPRGRFLKKIIAVALATIESLPSKNASELARCAVLNCAQWALDGRRSHTTTDEFRQRLSKTTIEMLAGLDDFNAALSKYPNQKILLHQGDASAIDSLPIFRKDGLRAKLVVTSPPYPGVHVLYHRWQVDGRRETPAPYWIADRTDGQGASYYCFGSRQGHETGAYFEAAFETLRSVRRVLADDGMMVQLIAFSKPDRDLPRYLDSMRMAGFKESFPLETRIWREVPNRKWHANARGITHSAREVLLVHLPD